MKVVINTSYGGFGLSKAARLYMVGLGIPLDAYTFDIPRHDPRLVQAVEDLGLNAYDEFGDLEIQDIEGTKYWIEEYDGLETLHTPQSIPWVDAANPLIPKAK
jgi:hypothetical protein